MNVKLPSRQLPGNLLVEVLQLKDGLGKEIETSHLILKEPSKKFRLEVVTKATWFSQLCHRARECVWPIALP